MVKQWYKHHNSKKGEP